MNEHAKCKKSDTKGHVSYICDIQEHVCDGVMANPQTEIRLLVAWEMTANRRFYIRKKMLWNYTTVMFTQFCENTKNLRMSRLWGGVNWMAHEGF